MYILMIALTPLSRDCLTLKSFVNEWVPTKNKLKEVWELSSNISRSSWRRESKFVLQPPRAESPGWWLGQDWANRRVLFNCHRVYKNWDLLPRFESWEVFWEVQISAFFWKFHRWGSSGLRFLRDGSWVTASLERVLCHSPAQTTGETRVCMWVAGGVEGQEEMISKNSGSFLKWHN